MNIREAFNDLIMSYERRSFIMNEMLDELKINGKHEMSKKYITLDNTGVILDIAEVIKWNLNTNRF